MHCANTNECFDQINAYFNEKKTGHFLLVNTENYDVYQTILQRLQADTGTKCVYVSDNCYPNGLPDTETAISKVSGIGTFALIGLSQALMLRSASYVEKAIGDVLGYSISGYGIILLDHCEDSLQKYILRDPRVKNRVIFVDGETSQLPKIKFVGSEEECIGYTPIASLPRLLAYLEKLSDNQGNRRPSVTSISKIPAKMFSDAVYSISTADGIYDSLISKHADIAGATEKKYGTDSQWKWLASSMKGKASLSELVCDKFGATTNLSAHISDVWDSGDKTMQWFLWLALKAFGEKQNLYMTLVLNHCDAVDDFERHIYLDLGDIAFSDTEFYKYYAERKKLIAQFPENLILVKAYCDKLGKHQKNEVYYLTDGSDQEKYEFVRCMSQYEYTPSEVQNAARNISKSLFQYLSDFVFDSVNTKLPDADIGFRESLTAYFRDYKFQKITNRISSEHLGKVTAYSFSPRPYNKLQPRSSIISHMDKSDAQCFFFDALGVEYLSYIVAKCEEYGLISEIAIGRCELPSITIKNKEFLQYFKDGNWKKIDALDEIKHHSQIYDFEKCAYPLHLFEELETIGEQLRLIQSQLMQGTINKALIVSDHGASRLAVIYGHELEATVELDQSGEHSGRCCLSSSDPNLPYAAYEDGYSILANYERFKGGRRANVEVHGGATLEEVVVPIITLTKRPENIELCFVEPVITLKPHTIPSLVLYSNVPLDNPRLLIDGEPYEGTFVGDKKHARFEIPKIKRKGTYVAEVYEGSKNLSIKLEFKVQKQTREVDLF